jgi:hypothetical protein
MTTATKTSPLYNEVVEVTQDFLGPASEQFITRQIKAHLNKDPDQLKAEDLEELARWIKVAIALLTEDGETVESYTANIMALAKQRAH